MKGNKKRDRYLQYFFHCNFIQIIVVEMKLDGNSAFKGFLELSDY